MHHTLFKTLARGLGLIAGDFYRGFIILDIIASALAMAQRVVVATRTRPSDTSRRRRP